MPYLTLLKELLEREKTRQEGLEALEDIMVLTKALVSSENRELIYFASQIKMKAEKAIRLIEGP